MTSRVSHTSIDCRNAFELSQWWKRVLDYTDVEGDPNEPGHDECMILARDGGHHLLFIEVPEAKSVKNRLHLDLRPTDRSQAQEVERLLGIGGTVLADRRGQYGPGTGWVTMADPEGNELCVLRSDAERAESAGDPDGGEAPA